jgi:L-lysine 2,3-aminomutase
LFDANILPYYLHLLDPVKGATHFDASKQEAIKLMAELIKRLPGFLVPKLVRELAGQPGKTPIDLGLEP